MSNGENNVELSNSASSFSKAFKDALSIGEKVEGISFCLLLSMVELENTFTLESIERYFRAEGKVRTELLNSVLSELYPEWNSLIEDATDKVKDIKAERNENRRQARLDAKLTAQKKVKASQNLLRDCLAGLIYFRTSELKLDALKLNNYKRLEFTTSEGIRYSKATALTFKDVVAFGTAIAEENEWKQAKPSGNKAQSSTAKGTVEALEADPKNEDLFMQLISHMTTLLTASDFASFDDDKAEALRKLETVIISKTYGDKDGNNIDVELLRSYYEQDDDKAPRERKSA